VYQRKLDQRRKTAIQCQSHGGVSSAQPFPRISKVIVVPKSGEPVVKWEAVIGSEVTNRRLPQDNLGRLGAQR
jgi:hypothetical protein